MSSRETSLLSSLPRLKRSSTKTLSRLPALRKTKDLLPTLLDATPITPTFLELQLDTLLSSTLSLKKVTNSSEKRRESTKNLNNPESPESLENLESLEKTRDLEEREPQEKTKDPETTRDLSLPKTRELQRR